MNRNRKRPAGAMLVRITNQADKHKGKKQRGEEIKGTVLIAGNAVIRAWLFAREFQINLVVGCDVANIPVLENLQSGAESDDNAAAHTLRRLLENAVGRFGRMRDRKNIKKRVQLLFGTGGDQLIHLADVLLFLGITGGNIEHQRLEQIHFSAVPEVVTSFAAGIFDDDITKKLGHQFLTADLRKTIP